MQINQNALQDFLGITKYLTMEEIKDEVKDYIDMNFAIYDEDHFDKVYEAFIYQIYQQDDENTMDARFRS